MHVRNTTGRSMSTSSVSTQMRVKSKAKRLLRASKWQCFILQVVLSVVLVFTIQHLGRSGFSLEGFHPLSHLRVRPFVYVYELPDRFNQKLLETDSLWTINSFGYGTESVIHRLLLSSGGIRTIDPDKADLFFVPIYAARFLEIQRKLGKRDKALENTGKFLEEGLRYIQTNYPFWKMYNGQNHFTVASHDFGRCSAIAFVDPAVLGDLFTLQINSESSLIKLPSALRLSIEKFSKTNSEHPPLCFNASSDFIIPSQTAARWRPVRAQERVKHIHEGKESREVKVDNNGLPVLQGSLFELDFYDSTFCVTSLSHPWSITFLTGAIVSGCIPVLTVSPDTDSLLLPWETFLDYNTFTVKVDLGTDPPNTQELSDRLQLVSRNPKELASLQNSLAGVQKYFSFDLEEFELINGYTTLISSLLNRATYFKNHPHVHVQAAANDALPRQASVQPKAAASDLLPPTLSSPAKLQPITEGSAKLRMCTPAMAPFVSGTMHFGDRMAQLVVFEAEILRGIVPGTGERQDDPNVVIQLLAFLEDESSIFKSAFDGWGGGYISNAHKELKMLCQFWPGHGRQHTAGGVPPLVTDALVAKYTQEYTVEIHCPLPSELPDYVLSHREFQLILKAEDEKSSILHMPHIPLCREEAGKEEHSLSPPLKLGICNYPYREHRPYDYNHGKAGNMTARLLEWIDAHLLLGVSRIYFYDRYWDEMLPLLQPYVERGVLVHVPFPMWSEVFYRKETYVNTTTPYLFPMIYDQILAYEHCMMQGRRHDMDWLFFTDVDEFLSYKGSSPGGLQKVMEKVDSQHNGSLPLAVVRIQRYNFEGAEEEWTPVLKSHTKRCENTMQHKYFDWDIGKMRPDSHDKLAARPQRMVGSKVEIHLTKQTPNGAIMVVDPTTLKIHHYASTKRDEYGKKKDSFSLCKMKDDIQKPDKNLVEDKSLAWVVDAIEQCQSSCNEDEPNFDKCGTLCGNWHKPSEERT